MNIGRLRHSVLLENEETGAVEGDVVTVYKKLNPSRWHCSIEPATTRDLERRAASTVIATATHLITGRYHPGITTKTRITKGDRNPDGSLTPGSRSFNVTGVQNPQERNEALVLTCEEVVK